MRKVFQTIFKRARFAAGVSACALLSAAIFSCSSTPQVVSIEPKSQVIEFKGQTKDQLFDTANKWAVQTFRNAEGVIEYSNASTGTVSGKYVYKSTDEVHSWGYPSVKAVITIECKDERLKMTAQPIEVLYFRGATAFSPAISEWRAITTDSQEYLNFDNEFASMQDSLKKYFSKTDSDW